ncbi:OapA N-terminal domain-containing protein, partial [Escherichia coli]
MPGRFELKPTLEKVWHAPDNFRFMDPLPPMHRRGIIIAAIILVVGFLLPSDDTPNAPVVTREAQLDIQSQSQPPTEEQLAPVAPEPIQEGQPEEQPQTTQTQPFQPDSGIDNQWRSYRVEPGKTMAQL